MLRVTLASILLEVARVLVHPNFDPVAFHLGPLAVRWYGLMYLVGFGIAFWLGRRRIRRSPAGPVTIAVLDDLLFYIVLGVVLGGRLGYVLFYKPGFYVAHLLEIPAVWLGALDGMETTVVAYTTDIPAFGGQWGEPFLIGPGTIHVAHTLEEHVLKNELLAAVEIYQNMVRRLCKRASK